MDCMSSRRGGGALQVAVVLAVFVPTTAFSPFQPGEKLSPDCKCNHTVKFAHGLVVVGLDTIRLLDLFPAGFSLSAQTPLSFRGISPLSRNLNARSRWYRCQIFANLHRLCTFMCRRVSLMPIGTCGAGLQRARQVIVAVKL